MTGLETITDVISSAEKDIFDFIPDLLNQDEIVSLPNYALEYIEFVANNPNTMPGLPTGFPRWDSCLGGGLRRGTVNMIAARPKVGKSYICLSIANYLIKNNVPVLYLDTELNKDLQATRWVALISKTNYSDIETGKFAKQQDIRDKVFKAVEEYKKYPFDHTNVSGKSPDEIISIMRRWISQRVGRDNNGRTKDCLIILDYLKTMNLKDIGNHQEYQYLGDVMTKLHNFAVKYDIPILSALQLNRDGISREDTGAVAGSDRIIWLCSSLTFLKRKTEEDYVSGDGKEYGDRKLIVIETRFGKGMDANNEYINVISNLERSELIEGKFNYEVLAEKNSLGLDDTDEDFIGGLDDNDGKEENNKSKKEIIF